ncbi:superinfection immunity protein [Bradyrhizobium erythrophlei]|uniref:Superinfection immunity protein n=1 Tax=Bradyrhizobium erythrophlei TaxID=1437360 RepID=A0A1M5NEA4_9BRAD|nr:superinfection immunity protein [Bradyrhizobium erythrophlei]SHG87904.1 Superinfection immunity protein [Bradyrhizobium erythrophlei]
MNNTSDNGAALIGLLVILSLYFIPTSISLIRRHRQTLAIFMTNLLLGWTILGWIAALIWACTAPKSEKVVIVHRDDR